jgi:hypothetical protein
LRHQHRISRFYRVVAITRTQEWKLPADNVDSVLIMNWISYTLAGINNENDARFESVLQLMDMAHDDPERCLALCVGIVAADASDLVLANVAAGPLEDMLVAHGAWRTDHRPHRG